MMARKYSLGEIERMRFCIRTIMLIPRGFAGSAGEFDRIIEDRLRTYMMNGTEPDELEEGARALLASLAP